jgi:hypothetical protein
MQQLAVPGSSSVVQLPRIAAWLRVASRFWLGRPEP